MKLAILLGAALLSACAAYSGSGLKPGTATLAEVVQVMGEPAMRWQDADGSVQLSYPKGPAGPQSLMVRVGKDGKLQSIRNVLVPEVTAKIVAGMSKEEVLRLIGPPIADRSTYSKARDELAWDWRYEEMPSELSYFSVLFDATRGTVRSTLVIPDPKMGMP